MPFYAVNKGHIPGIYNSWDECKTQIHKFSGAVFKKFNSYVDAENFYKSGVEYNVAKIIQEDSFDRTVYTDGSCYGNGKKPSFGGYGIYFNDSNIQNVSEPLLGNCTNNIAELSAILQVLILLEDHLKLGKSLLIVSDSLYSIKAITERCKKYSEQGWDNSIPNISLIKRIYKLYSKYKNIYFKHIYSHTNLKDKHSIGNNKADELANLALLKSIDCSNNLGKVKFTIGKYKDKELSEVTDAEYVRNFINTYKKDKAFIYILKKYY